ncbi:MAG: pacearchaeosortase [Nanoarchaeota archaeon]
MKQREIIQLLARYLILIILSIGNLYLFYAVFTPLTVYPVSWILNIFYNAFIMNETMINLNGIIISIIPACVAGAAYYLLLVLNMTTPMKINKRIKSILFLFLSFLALNILRMIIFSTLYLNGFEYFNLAHKTVWYAGSTIILAGIWFVNVWIFNINKIPVYTDINEIVKSIR